MSGWLGLDCLDNLWPEAYPNLALCDWRAWFESCAKLYMGKSSCSIPRLIYVFQFTWQKVKMVLASIFTTLLILNWANLVGYSSPSMKIHCVHNWSKALIRNWAKENRAVCFILYIMCRKKSRELKLLSRPIFSVIQSRVLFKKSVYANVLIQENVYASVSVQENVYGNVFINESVNANVVFT